MIGVLVTTLVIGPFNYFGSGLTKVASASHRCTIDSMRMFFVCKQINFWLFYLKLNIFRERLHILRLGKD